LRGSSAAATKADPPKSCKGSCGSCHFMVGLRPRAAKRSVLLRRPRRIREMTTRVFAQSCASEQRKGAPTTSVWISLAAVAHSRSTRGQPISALRERETGQACDQSFSAPIHN
jgi:hypothetical protein